MTSCPKTSGEMNNLKDNLNHDGKPEKVLCLLKTCSKTSSKTKRFHQDAAL